jgi:LPS sulfotransferase NodH
MPALPHPHAEDVVIRRESSGTFTIGTGSGTAQIACRFFEDALQRAWSFASHQQLRLWYTADGLNCSRLADVRLLRRIWNEYVEMPGLRLTRQQAQRLWAVEADVCASLLESLVEVKFLMRGADGKYARRADATEPVARLRMAKTEIGAHPAAGTLRQVR